MSEKKENRKVFKGGKIFLGGLPPSLNLEELSQLLAPLGDIRVKLVLQKDSSLNLGFAFLYPKDKATRERLLYSELKVRGRKLQFQPSFVEKNSNMPSNKRLFIRNLPYNISDEHLTKFFRSFCNIRAAYSIMDSSRKPKGYGFIDLYTAQDAEKLLSISTYQIMNNTVHLELYNPQRRPEKPLSSEIPIAKKNSSKGIVSRQLLDTCSASQQTLTMPPWCDPSRTQWQRMALDHSGLNIRFNLQVSSAHQGSR